MQVGATPSAARRVRLLAVDDHQDSAELLARIAERCGYEAAATSDPSRAGELLASWQPQIVALDLCMPETDGLELLKQLADAGFGGAVVIVSGQEAWFLETAARFGEAHGLKVAALLEKPVAATALRQVLAGLAPTG